MNIKESDAIDGKDPFIQMLLAVIYFILPVIAYFIIKFFIIESIVYGFDISRESIKPFAEISSFFIIGIMVISAFFSKEQFYLSVNGNRVRPAIVQILSPKLSDGGTKFVLFSTGFALKPPNFILKLIPNELEIEKERVKSFDQFKVTVKNTEVVIKISMAWRPHQIFLSSFIQNGESKDVENLLNQLDAKCHQIIESYVTENYQEVDQVRKDQEKIAEYTKRRLQRFADYLGIEVFDISFEKCDYSDDTQKKLNKIKETEVVTEIAEKLIQLGMEPTMAGVQAAVMAEIKNAEIAHKIFEVKGSDNIAKALEGLGPAINSIAEKMKGGESKK